MLRKLNFRAIFCLLVFVFPFTFLDIEIQAEGRESSDDFKSETLKLAAWNIEKLGYNVKKRKHADLQKMADVLSRYHFIAITELMHKNALESFLGKEGGRIIKWKGDEKDGQLVKLKDEKFQQLKTEGPLDFKDEDFEEFEKEGYPEWDFREVLRILSIDKKRNYRCLISPKVGNDNAEYYGLLYDEELVSAVNVGDLYRDMDDGNDDFERDPYWATFCAGEFDFTVIVVHTDPDDAKKECSLMDEVYVEVQKANEDEQDVLLVGDFNLDPSHAAFKEVKEVGEQIDTMRALFCKENGCKSSLAKDKPLYDNIIFDTHHLKEYAKNCGIYLFDVDEELKCCEGKVKKDDVPDGNLKEFREVSNHYPVWAEFNTHEDSDPKEPDGDADDSGR